MKLNSASRNRPAPTSYDRISRYEATHQGGLNILEKSRPAATWSRVSPAVLGDIDRYVQSLARR